MNLSNTLPNRKLLIAVGNSRSALKWRNTEILWPDLVKKLSLTTRTRESISEYASMAKAERDRIKDVGGFVGGYLKDGRRNKKSVVFRSVITLDADHADNMLISDAGELNCAYMIYSTHSHTSAAPRLRLVIPLSRDVLPDEYVAVSQRVAEKLGLEKIDPASYKVEQLMYWPSTPEDGEFVNISASGDFLDPDAVLATYADWHDRTLWPANTMLESNAENEAHVLKDQENPLQKRGLIGAFCRAHSVSNIMETILQDKYTLVSNYPGSMSRYTYTEGSTTGGMIVYDDLFAFSHHATDPASYRLCNAFDLVRMHLFTPGSTNADGNIISEKESVRLMQDYASNDPDTRMQLAKDKAASITEDFGSLEETPDEDLSWLKKLEYDKAGNIKSCYSNLLLIVQNDPRLKGIVFNELSDSLEIKDSIAPAPWKHKDRFWRDVDDKQFISYIETHYCHFSANSMDVALSKVADDRSYHPVLDYFAGLPAWDGIPRVDTLLIDYLGSPDNEYVRAVTRKMLCGAIRRVQQPGIKFDTMLVLSGPQGIGKSTLISKLGKAWFNDSLSLSDTRDKTAAEKLQGFWILEIGELAGLRKTDVEVLRSFLSRQNDIYRAAFGKRATPHPRQCVFVGTTNAVNGYLRDTTGNRRFWPVETPGGGTKRSWQITKEEIDQIWAETLHWIEQGESLILDEKTEALAQEAQREAMEVDEREGIVREYLDKLLPDNWDDLTILDRRSFLRCEDRFLGVKQKEGTVLRDTVSPIEIWAECFEQDPGRFDRYNSIEIISILTRLGWKRSTCNSSSVRKRKLYGPQRCFDRPVAENENRREERKVESSSTPAVA